MENDVYIVNGLRTFIGSKGKIFKNIPAEDLASAVIAELESKNRKLNLKTNTVILGNATGGGGNMARLALLKAGLFDDTVGITNAATSCLFSDGAAFITLADSEILCGAEPDFFGTGYSFKIKSAADAGGNRHRSPESLVCATEG